MTKLDAIEELKQLFRTEIGLDADENPADFSGWLFLKRQKSMMAVIEDLGVTLHFSSGCTGSCWPAAWH